MNHESVYWVQGSRETDIHLGVFVLKREFKFAKEQRGNAEFLNQDGHGSEVKMKFEFGGLESFDGRFASIGKLLSYWPFLDSC